MTHTLHVKRSDEWETPPKLFAELNDEFRFNFDPCCTIENKKTRYGWPQPGPDGLLMHWGVGLTTRAFVNPPYSDIYPWFKKAAEEIGSGRCEIAVFLVPSRTGTKWWHDYAQ